MTDKATIATYLPVTIMLACSLGLSHTAQAGTIYSPTMYGGPSQTSAICYVRNVSRKPVVVTAAAITAPDGSPVSLSQDTCTQEALQPGTTCFVAANVSSFSAYGSSVTVKGKTKGIRATLEMRDSFGTARAGDLH